MAKLLKKQIPMSPPAEEYSATAFRRTEETKATTRHILDVAYGPEDDQDIDIYLPDDANATNVPVFMFVHGGSWTHGYKEWLGFMAPAFTTLPAIFVSVSYRLGPGHEIPLPGGGLSKCPEVGIRKHLETRRKPRPNLRGWTLCRRTSGGDASP